MRKGFKALLLIFWLALIFYLSSQNGKVSGNLSKGLLLIIANFINQFYRIDSVSFVATFGFLIRKIAHFTEYFILQIIAYENYREYRSRQFIFVIIFCIGYAFLDEFHQLFVLGRSGQLLDVAIDSFGVLISYFFWHRLLKK